MTVGKTPSSSGSRLRTTWKSTTVHLRYRDPPLLAMNQRTLRKGGRRLRYAGCGRGAAFGDLERWLDRRRRHFFGDRPQIFPNRGEFALAHHHPPGKRKPTAMVSAPAFK